MCLLFFNAKQEVVEEEKGQEMETLTGTDGTQVLWNPVSGDYYTTPDNNQVIVDPDTQKTIIHTVTSQPRHMLQYMYHDNGRKWAQPKGPGYLTIEDAIEAAKQQGFNVRPGIKMHVMKTDQGGWQIVGISPKE